MAKINLLGASIHRLETNCYGSGIYSPRGMEVHYFRPDIPRSKLLMADINPIDVKKPPQTIINNDIPYTRPEEIPAAEIFKMGDFKFLTYKILKSRAATVTACQKFYCCRASYAIKDRFHETYAVGVFQGWLVAGANKLYFQICTLVQCPGGVCGTKIPGVKTKFRYIHLSAHGWLDRYIFPSLTVMYSKYMELDPGLWKYSVGRGIETRPGTLTPLHSANLVARIYARDYLLHVKKSHPGREGSIKMALKYMLYLMTAYVYNN